MIVFCAKCGTTLAEPSDACPVCEGERPSGMARFCAGLASSLNRGRSLDEAAEDARVVASPKAAEA